MSFYINNTNPNRPGPLSGNPINGICEKVLIETTKVFDACVSQTTETGIILPVTSFSSKSNWRRCGGFRHCHWQTWANSKLCQRFNDNHNSAHCYLSWRKRCYRNRHIKPCSAKKHSAIRTTAINDAYWNQGKRHLLKHDWHIFSREYLYSNRMPSNSHQSYCRCWPAYPIIWLPSIATLSSLPKLQRMPRRWRPATLPNGNKLDNNQCK